jgi:hypothetical protein
MAPTQMMNPTVPANFISDAFEDDPTAAASEFGNLANGLQWRNDVAAYVDRETIEALIAPDRFELPAQERVTYGAFVDAAGGSGSDSMTMAIGHRDDERVILDAVREIRPRFNPSEAVAEFAALLRQYRIRTVSGERYGGAWVSVLCEPGHCLQAGGDDEERDLPERLAAADERARRAVGQQASSATLLRRLRFDASIIH